MHGGGLDPGWYDYPSLVIEALAPFQLWLDEPSYLAGRLAVVAFGVAGVAAAWWLGSRAYDTTAGFVAAAFTAVATTHVAYSRTAVTDVPFTTLATASLALLVSRRLELAGAAAGLAAAAKYPGVVLLVPLVVVGYREWRRLAVAVGLAVAAFALASPFVLVHAGAAAEDARRVSERAQAGWLGFEGDGPAIVAFADRLWEAVGPALLVAAAALVVAVVRRRRADLVLASFALAYYVTLLPIDAHFDRYVLPLVPVLGALAGSLRPLVPVTLLLLIVPLTWSIRDTRELTRTDTREAAQAWIEERVPAGCARGVRSLGAALRAGGAAARASRPLAGAGPEAGCGRAPKARDRLRRRVGRRRRPGRGGRGRLSRRGALLRRPRTLGDPGLSPRPRRRLRRAVGKHLPPRLDDPPPAEAARDMSRGLAPGHGCRGLVGCDESVTKRPRCLVCRGAFGQDRWDSAARRPIAA